MFETVVHPVPPRERYSFLLSVVLHLTILTGLVLVPLVFYPELADLRFVTHLYGGPLPEPAPPPQPPQGIPVPRTASFPARITNPWVPPTFVPDAIPAPDDLALPDQMMGDSPGSVLVPGIPGGFAGGDFRGAGPVGDGVPQIQPPPPPPQVRKEPFRIGGSVLAAKLVRRVDPAYPELAKRARVQGAVLLEVLVDALGEVESVRVVSGPALLADAAVTAVRQWRYSPTLLNGEPVPVTAVVTVRFVLQ